MRYQVSNLGEIATAFRRRQQEELTAYERAKTRRDQFTAEARAQVWGEAAAILDNTVMVPTPPEQKK